MMLTSGFVLFFFFSSRRRHTRCSRDWSSDVCSSDLGQPRAAPARPGFLPEDAARLVGWSALFGSPPFPRTALVVLSTPRSASLTASSEGKAAATSGSSKTKLLPLRSRATYLPRTPPFIDAKSYSGRRSLSLCRFALLIELSLAPRRSTGADDADGVVSLRVGHNQDVSPRGCTDCQETGLRLGVRLVGKRCRQRILENRSGLVEAARCLLRFAAAFAGSHSNCTARVYGPVPGDHQTAERPRSAARGARPL